MDSNTPICQSCGMPMLKAEDFGSGDYCRHCYNNGQFTNPDISIEQMIERLLPFATKMGMSEDTARKMGHKTLPKLKRWKKS